jgi:MoaA/NifB/PqqE/SkfB family radical SAM enzyme
LTGGEAFLRPDCFDLIEAIYAGRPQIAFAVLTNASLTDRGSARRSWNSGNIRSGHHRGKRSYA